MNNLYKIFTFSILSIISCNKKQDWKQSIFDEKISTNDSMKLMNKFYDPEELYDDSISSNKKTSFVIYDNDDNKNICKVKIANDTLHINIGYSTGFSSHGFEVLYYDKKYNIVPYYGTDNVAIIVDDNGKEIQKLPPKYFFHNQRLVLNKTNYKKGDSIFGFIDFSSLEIEGNQKSKHKGRGYFRTKIQ
ncbi:MAG: hypothetical protein E2590_06290 [Chryseobacterium sp.]|nr:hypothetical protein [Chryseobacterium sp.]